MDQSTPGFPVLHYLSQLAQMHFHWFGDAIQPPHPLSSPSPPARNHSQHQALFRWVGSWHQVAKILELQHQYFQWIFRWFPDFLQMTDLISLLSIGLSRVLQHHNSKASVLWHSAFFMVQFSHPYKATGKTTALTRWTFVCKRQLCFLTCYLVCHSFSPKEQVSLNFVVAVTIRNDIGTQKNKICHCFPLSPPICHEVMKPDIMILVFWTLNLEPAFSLSSITLIKRLFSSSLLSAIKRYHLHIWGCWYFSWQS